MQSLSESTLQMHVTALVRAGANPQMPQMPRLPLPLVRALELALVREWAQGRTRGGQAWVLEQAVERARVLVGERVLEQAGKRAEAGDRAGERAQARAQAWAWAQAHVVTYGEVLADSELMDIIYSIEPDDRRQLARHLWQYSKHWWLIQIIAPITRLPQELLHQIFLIIIDNANHSPLVLMRVSKLWHSIVTGIWASLKLGTTTPRDAVVRKLEGNQWLLDVVIDTEFDRHDFTPLEGAYQAIFAAIQAASRWRTLVVKTFPAQTDLPEDLVNSGLQQSSDIVMSRLRSFKIKFPCEMSSFLQRLLRILGTATGGELTTIEINSASVISFLALTYPSIFHSVKVLYLDIPRLPNPVDLLPHLHQLEAFTASHLSLPIYLNDVDIPFVHTLRHLTLNHVSIQWMSGRTFHALESCTLLFPIHRHVLHTFSTTLPNCNDLTFQGYPLDVLNGISTKNLTDLTVKCSSFERPRGSRELVRFSSRALRESRLAPRILHISVEATNQAWIKAFTFMSSLEELVIHNAQPSSLGVKVLQSLVIHPGHRDHLGTSATPGRQYTPLCPSLKRLGLRYHRWLRPSEQIDLIPEFVSIIWSRQQSEFSLQSFRIWIRNDHEGPLELIEGSQISFKVLECLANEGKIKGENLLQLVLSGLWRISV